MSPRGPLLVTLEIAASAATPGCTDFFAFFHGKTAAVKG